MSTYLYRLARIALQRPWLVVGGWAVIILVVATILIVNPPKISNEMHINGTAAQEVIDHLAEVLPQSSGGQATIAFVAPDGQRIDDGSERSALLGAIDAVSRSNHVISPSALARAEMDKGAGSPTVSAFLAIARDPMKPPRVGAPTQWVVNGQMVPGCRSRRTGEWRSSSSSSTGKRMRYRTAPWNEPLMRHEIHCRTAISQYCHRPA